MRTVHVPARAGWRLVGSRAIVRSARVKGTPRVLRIDLRGKRAGSYNVFISARYLRAGVTKTVRSERHLSVVCS